MISCWSNENFKTWEIIIPAPISNPFGLSQHDQTLWKQIVGPSILHLHKTKQKAAMKHMVNALNDLMLIKWKLQNMRNCNSNHQSFIQWSVPQASITIDPVVQPTVVSSLRFHTSPKPSVCEQNEAVALIQQWMQPCNRAHNSLLVIHWWCQCTVVKKSSCVDGLLFNQQLFQVWDFTLLPNLLSVNTMKLTVTHRSMS